MTSADGRKWGEPQPLAQHRAWATTRSAGAHGGRVGTAFDYHPQPGGLNARTNLYYLETPDAGKTWTTADGQGGRRRR